jgi:hypothetical protein
VNAFVKKFSTPKLKRFMLIMLFCLFCAQALTAVADSMLNRLGRILTSMTKMPWK